MAQSRTPSKAHAKRRRIARSPRYRHLRDDDNLIRISGAGLRDDFEGRYQDVSETGLRFRARRPQALRVGDIVEVAMSAPGMHGPGSGNGLHVRAEIMRADGDQDFSVRFSALSGENQKRLTAGLRAGFERAALEPVVLGLKRIASFLRERAVVLFLLAAAVALAWVAMTWITAPRGNYRPDKTVPWGDRTF